MTEKSTERILESWFFEAPVYEGGKLLRAPAEAIYRRDYLRLTWLPLVMTDKNEAPVVKLTPVTEGEKRGWKVETAMRSKPDTTSNTNPSQNN